MLLTDQPAFIPDAKAYEKWLIGRTRAHVKRDRHRHIELVNETTYRMGSMGPAWMRGHLSIETTSDFCGRTG